jgi:GNAT superfamily N-acetyltransferase
MQQLCSRLWTPRSRFHPGQLAWNRYSHPVDPDRPADGEAISLWRRDGVVVGFGWAEAPDWLELQVDPAFPEVAEAVVEWFEELSDADTQSVLVMAGDVSESALAAAGFRPEPDAPYFDHHVLDLAELPLVPGVPPGVPPRVPPGASPGPAHAGYRLRSVDPSEAAERAAVHAGAWAELGPSRVSPAAYAGLMTAWPYRADLDWVAVDPRGVMVASALVWLDPATTACLVEPVGCLPEHRGRGLAGAVTRAALHRARELGATVAQVSPRGDDAYPGPRRLYRSLGFRSGARTVTWTRSLH